MIIFWIILVFVVIFAAVAFVGAPYVPTHKNALAKALNMLPLKPGDRVVDLGSGDGALLAAAASRGFKATGYEINPVLYVLSMLRCWRWRKAVDIKLANFWNADIPADTIAIYVFLAGPFMDRLSKRLKQLSKSRSEPLYVVSYGFDVPAMTKLKTVAGMNLYKLKPGKH